MFVKSVLLSGGAHHHPLLFFFLAHYRSQHSAGKKQKIAAKILHIIQADHILDPESKEKRFAPQHRYYIYLFLKKYGTVTEATILQKCLGELQINVFHSSAAQHLCMCKYSCGV